MLCTKPKTAPRRPISFSAPETSFLGSFYFCSSIHYPFVMINDKINIRKMNTFRCDLRGYAKLKFDEIVLTEEELEALKTVNESCVLVEPHNKDVFYRLKYFDFVEISALSKWPDGVKFSGIPKGAMIKERGKDYLLYIDAKSKSEKRKKHHDLFVAAFGTVVGAIAMYVIERLPIIISFIKHLIN